MKTSKKASIQKITPFLWFDNQAEEAAKFYVSVFKNAGIKFCRFFCLIIEPQERSNFLNGPLF